jgi:hypothetical protein
MSSMSSSRVVAHNCKLLTRSTTTPAMRSNRLCRQSLVPGCRHRTRRLRGTTGRRQSQSHTTMASTSARSSSSRLSPPHSSSLAPTSSMQPRQRNYACSSPVALHWRARPRELHRSTTHIGVPGKAATATACTRSAPPDT